MKKQKIAPTAFTPTMGAYSHGYIVDAGPSRTVYVTGQIALDDKGELVSEDVAEQTQFVFGRVATVLGEAGLSLDDVVKVQIFVTDIRDFARVSPIRNAFLAKSEPVSTLVQVGALVHPGCKIEVEAIAVRELDPGSAH